MLWQLLKDMRNNCHIALQPETDSPRENYANIALCRPAESASSIAASRTAALGTAAPGPAAAAAGVAAALVP